MPHGFTLLEMLVVLALAALLMAIATPRLYETGVAYIESAELEALVASIEGLPHRMRADRSGVWTIRSDAEARAHLALPGEWSSAWETPLTVMPTGICSQARLTLDTGRRRLALDIAAPYCHVAVR